MILKGEHDMKKIQLSRRSAELLLAAVIIARATSNLFSKLILEGMGIFNLLGLRFSLAFALLSVLFFRRLKSAGIKTISAGAVMGGIYFLVMTADLNGLKRMSSGNAAFLCNTAIVIVPLLQAVIKRSLPRGKAILSVIFCIFGVGILTIGSRMGSGSACPAPESAGNVKSAARHAARNLVFRMVLNLRKQYAPKCPA